MTKEEQLYDLIAYLSVSAKEMYNDPQIYAPLRLLSAITRLTDMFASDEGVDQLYLREIQQMIEAKRSLLLNDREQFGEFLDQLIFKIAGRNLT